jgi:hypothetical protein
VLFWSLDRLSREGVPKRSSTCNDSNSGVEWWSYREEYLRSVGVFRDALLAILAAIAKQECIRISERVMAGLNRARKASNCAGQRRHYGPNACMSCGSGPEHAPDRGRNRVSVMTVQRAFSRPHKRHIATRI